MRFVTSSQFKFGVVVSEPFKCKALDVPMACQDCFEGDLDITNPANYLELELVAVEVFINKEGDIVDEIRAVNPGHLKDWESYQGTNNQGDCTIYDPATSHLALARALTKF